MLEALLYLLGGEFELSPITSRAKEHIVEVLHALFTKITPCSVPLTDQLVAILAQSVLSFRNAVPVDSSEPQYVEFAKLSLINVSRRLLRKNIFNELFIVCTNDFVQIMEELVFHYCSAYDPTKKKLVSISVLQCLSIHGDEDILRQFYLHDW